MYHSHSHVLLRSFLCFQILTLTFSSFVVTIPIPFHLFKQLHWIPQWIWVNHRMYTAVHYHCLNSQSTCCFSALPPMFLIAVPWVPLKYLTPFLWPSAFLLSYSFHFYFTDNRKVQFLGFAGNPFRFLRLSCYLFIRIVVPVSPYLPLQWYNSLSM